MRFFYNTGMWLYALLVFLATPFNKKAKLFYDGRKQWMKRLKAVIPHDAHIIWFHCSSLGEFEQGRPLMEACRRQFPAHKILLTFFSPSGYEIRKHYSGADWVFYLPVDTPGNARHFIETVKPQAVLFIKYDFWYNMLRHLKRQGIPTYLVSAIFRPSQVFFKWYGGFFRKMLTAYQCLFVQNEASKELLATVGITQVMVTGDTRFDRVWEQSQQPKAFPVINHFAAAQPVIVAGSTWPADEEKLAAALSALPKNTKLIIAPHEIHEAHLADIEKRFAAFGTQRYSTATMDTDFQRTRVLLLDTIGMLSSVYRYGCIACIGGGFGTGIHNILEAAVYGLPVVFGPNYRRFQEACDLLAQGGAYRFDTAHELADILQKWLADQSASHLLGAINHQYVVQHTGATQAILNELRQRPVAISPTR